MSHNAGGGDAVRKEGEGGEEGRGGESSLGISVTYLRLHHSPVMTWDDPSFLSLRWG